MDRRDWVKPHLPDYYNEMGVNMKITAGPAIEKPGEMAAILTKLQDVGCFVCG